MHHKDEEPKATGVGLGVPELGRDRLQVWLQLLLQELLCRG